MEPRTTLQYKGQTYPFYKTNRGRVNFENAGFTTQDALEGKTTAMLAFIYYNLVDCAKRVNAPIADSFEEFIDNSESDIDDVFLRLYEIRLSEEYNQNQDEAKNLQAPDQAGQ